MKESEFQSELIKELKLIFPGCLVYKNEGKQGFPDLTLLWNDKWALLECKRSGGAHHQPNQDYYIDKADAMSFARLIFPENKEEVLDELQQAFRHGG